MRNDLERDLESVANGAYRWCGRPAIYVHYWADDYTPLCGMCSAEFGEDEVVAFHGDDVCMRVFTEQRTGDETI